MEKVFVLLKEEVYEGEKKEEVKVFSSLDKAKKEFKKMKFDILNDIDDPQPDTDEITSGYVYNQSELNFELYQKGYYCGDHTTVSIIESEVE